MELKTFEIGEKNAKLHWYKSETVIEDPQPCVLICPGGSYLYVSQREGEPMALEFLKEGYQVFLLEYTTIGTKLKDENKDGTRNEMYEALFQTPREETIGSEFPNPLIEAALSMKFIRENNHKFNIDSERVGVVGFSAGGHLAATLGAHWHTDWLEEKTKTKKQLYKPNFLVLGYPILDYKLNEEIAKQQGNSDPNFMNMVKRVTFGEEYDEHQMNLTIVKNYITEYMPKTFVWHTTGDRLVYVKNVIDFVDALEDNKVEWELHVFNGRNHGMSVANEIVGRNDETVKKWIPLMFDFLNKFN